MIYYAMRYGFDFAKYCRRNKAQYLLQGACRPPERLLGAVVIPAMNESSGELAAVLEHIRRAENSSRFAVITVVNQPPDAPEEVCRNNQNCLKMLASGTTLYLDCTAPGLTYGVGEARKTGMDAALALLGENNPDGIIFSLDADTLISEDYFTGAEKFFKNHPECGGGVFDFQHRTPDEPETAGIIRRYESYIRNYAAGLKYARSPYSYTAIGSAFAVRCSAYLKAGGMRKRTAGEDFYFLQALRKCSEIGQIPEAKVFPSARLSMRTPFGTGRKLHECLVNGGVIQDFPPSAFEALKTVLEHAREIRSGNAFVSSLPEELREFFSDFPALWDGLQARNIHDDFAFHRWFDALKTLQFIKFAARLSG